MREGHDAIAEHADTLEARERDLTRGVMSLICRSTGRRRTPDECRRLDALVREIRGVRDARREAARGT